MPRTTLSSRLRALGVIAIVSAALLSACGSSSKSDSSGSATTAADSTLSKSDFVSQSKSVCKDMAASVTTKNGELKAANAAKDTKAAAVVLTDISKLYADARTKIAGLKPPSDGAVAQQALVSMLGKFAGAFDAQQRALSGDTTVSVPEPDAFNKDIDAAAKPAEDYGISC